jgi:hypothetical protein
LRRISIACILIGGFHPPYKNGLPRQQFLRTAQQPFHSMPICVPAHRLGHASLGNLLAEPLPLEVIRQLVDQVLCVAVCGEVHAVAKQLGLAVVGHIIGQYQRTTPDSLENPHVDVVLDAAVEDDSRCGVSPCHVVEITPANERMGISLLNHVENE